MKIKTTCERVVFSLGFFYFLIIPFGKLNYNLAEKFSRLPLEGKLSPKVTDEV